MDLRDRLARLGVQKGIRQRKAPAARLKRGPGIEQVIPGELIETESGSFFLVQEAYPLEYRHGDWPLAAALEKPSLDLLPLARDVSFAGLDLEDAVFLDTETTGLAGGTGTYAFLVGIGYFQDGAFRLAQFFMRDYDEEAAMLVELGRALERFSALVSFNGRAFDWPLLETRFILARRPVPMDDALHLDLLHLARRLWRARLPSCSLSSLEEHVLGVRRTSQDVPGWLVPQLYFDYLRSGDASPLGQVFYHNAQDVLSLVTLSAYLGRIGKDPFNGCLWHGEDFGSLGRLFEMSGDPEAAIQAYRRALACPASAKSRRAIVFQLSFLYKQLGEREKAVELWHSALGEGKLYPYIELAKYYEHWSKDYEQAARLVGEAISLVRAPGYPEARRQRDLAELEHRLRRLQRKCSTVEKPDWGG